MEYNKRFHDLDALRAIAMLLGIVLHAILFVKPTETLAVPASVQSVIELTGTHPPEAVRPYILIRKVIHGFRMPLFFLISGFFTAMLWKSRGLKSLLVHRGKRILLPMLVFVSLLWVVFPMASQLGKLAANALDSDVRSDTQSTFSDRSPLFDSGEQRFTDHGFDRSRSATGAITLSPRDSAIQVRSDRDALVTLGFMGDMPASIPRGWIFLRSISEGKTLLHLWFLNYLIWLVPITVVPQCSMTHFGPDTTQGDGSPGPRC